MLLGGKADVHLGGDTDSVNSATRPGYTSGYHPADVVAGGGGIRAALRHRDFRLLLAGQAVSGTGDWLYNVALVVYVLDLTGSGTWVAATSLVRFLPYVLFGTFGGVIADRYDRRRVMVVADLARAGVMTGLTVVAASKGPAFAAVLLAGCSTVFSSAYLPAVRAATPTLVTEDDLAAANTLTSTVDNVALALGPAIGGSSWCSARRRRRSR